MSMLSFLIPENSALDRTRCMKIALIHDLAESIVGDITVSLTSFNLLRQSLLENYKP
jgi:5'-deoxynucleotidase YfbR-like HD superfamily hydrolase